MSGKNQKDRKRCLITKRFFSQSLSWNEYWFINKFNWPPNIYSFGCETELELENLLKSKLECGNISFSMVIKEISG